MRSALLMPWVALGLLLPAPANADMFERDDIITNPTWQRFSVCYDNGCRSLAIVSLSEAQWELVKAALLPAAESAADEREHLREAIALMEKFAGEATGTWKDKGGTFNFGSDGQMDCIDESTNTTLYLTLFQRYDLLHHHRVVDRATRGWFIFGWPHATAVIREIAGTARWAVDSWFLDNGEPPYVLPLEVWRAGWRPQIQPGAR
jgi:hypothetical protein